MSAPLLPRVDEGICRWCDDLDGASCPRCVCGAHARWSVADLAGRDDEPITAALLCSDHLAGGLELLDWTLDVVHVYDIGQGGAVVVTSPVSRDRLDAIKTLDVYGEAWQALLAAAAYALDADDRIAALEAEVERLRSATEEPIEVETDPDVFTDRYGHPLTASLKQSKHAT